MAFSGLPSTTQNKILQCINEGLDLYHKQMESSRIAGTASELIAMTMAVGITSMVQKAIDLHPESSNPPPAPLKFQDLSVEMRVAARSIVESHLSTFREAIAYPHCRERLFARTAESIAASVMDCVFVATSVGTAPPERKAPRTSEETKEGDLPSLIGATSSADSDGQDITYFIYDNGLILCFVPCASPDRVWTRIKPPLELLRSSKEL